MRIGLFGKLQAKRDFIAVSTPRPFLSVWEPWMQSAMATSRMQLDSDWQSHFLTAPIWRFWLGHALCGASVVGAVMSSMDGVGRYFPLTALAYAEAGEEIAPPEIDSQDRWFEAVEEFLLWTLETNTAFEAVAAALGDLPHPQGAPDAQPARVEIVPSGAVMARLADASFSDAFAAVRRADYARLYEWATYWWSAGGVDYEPCAMACARMPDPILYTSMLTGRFESFAPVHPDSGTGG